jgi:cell division protein FtsB
MADEGWTTLATDADAKALAARLAKLEHEVAALTAAVANLADAVKLVAEGA